MAYACARQQACLKSGFRESFSLVPFIPPHLPNSVRIELGTGLESGAVSHHDDGTVNCDDSDCSSSTTAAY